MARTEAPQSNVASIEDQANRHRGSQRDKGCGQPGVGAEQTREAVSVASPDDRLVPKHVPTAIALAGLACVIGAVALGVLGSLTAALVAMAFGVVALVVAFVMATRVGALRVLRIRIFKVCELLAIFGPDEPTGQDGGPTPPTLEGLEVVEQLEVFDRAAVPAAPR